MITRLLYEGFFYLIAELNTPQPGLFVFKREEGTPVINGTYRQGVGVMADLQESPNENLAFLPGRCAPLLLPRVEQAEKDGVFKAAGVNAKAFLDAITSHPKYAAGRDDLAEAAISVAYGVTLPQRLPQDVPPPSLL